MMQGVGWGSTTVNAIFSVYGVLVMAWSIYYLIHSFRPGELPWTSCSEFAFPSSNMSDKNSEYVLNINLITI